MSIESRLLTQQQAANCVTKMCAINVASLIDKAQEPVGEMVKLYQKTNPAFFVAFSEEVLGEVISTTQQNLDVCGDMAASGTEHDIMRWYNHSARIEQLRAETEKMLIPVIHFSEALNLSVEEAKARDILKKSEQHVATLEKMIHDAEQRDQRRADEANNEAKRLLDGIRNASEEAGVTAPANFYKHQAEAHEDGMSLWLLLSSVVGMLLLVLLWHGETFAEFINNQKIDGIVSEPTGSLLLGAIVHFIVNNALLFSTLAYMLFFCVKNYMAHRHNYVVNQHRHNALRTYRALVDATQQDGNARDIVLMQAAHCIFAPQSSGYAKGDGGGDAMRFIPMEALKEGGEAISKAKNA